MQCPCPVDSFYLHEAQDFKQIFILLFSRLWKETSRFLCLAEQSVSACTHTISSAHPFLPEPNNLSIYSCKRAPQKSRSYYFQVSLIRNTSNTWKNGTLPIPLLLIAKKFSKLNCTRMNYSSNTSYSAARILFSFVINEYCVCGVLRHSRHH